MSDIRVFENDTFGLLRVVNNDENNPKFVARDVCEALGIINPSDAIKNLDDDEKGVEKVYTLGGVQNTLVITESGLYALIMRSNKPAAREFRKWVTSVILPTIRKTGQFGNSKDIVQNVLNNPDFAIELLKQLKDERTKRNELEEQMQAALRINSIRSDMPYEHGLKRYIHGVIAGFTSDEDSCPRSDNYYRIGFRAGRKNGDNEKFKQEFYEFCGRVLKGIPLQ